MNFNFWHVNEEKQLFKTQLFRNLFLPLEILYYQWGLNVRYFLYFSWGKVERLFLEFSSYVLTFNGVYKLLEMGDISCDWLMWECPSLIKIFSVFSSILSHYCFNELLWQILTWILDCRIWCCGGNRQIHMDYPVEEKGQRGHFLKGRAPRPLPWQAFIAFLGTLHLG